MTYRNLVVALAIAGLLLASLLVSVSGNITPSASADIGGAITSRSTSLLMAGTTSYTLASQNSSPVLADAYGSIIIQASNVVTGSQIMTLTPQFSNWPPGSTASCSAVPAASWTKGTIYSVQASASSTTTIVSTVVTETPALTTTSLVQIVSGAPTWTPLYPAIVLTGNSSDLMEIPAQGRCFRLAVSFNDLGDGGSRYTPTVQLRLLNRQ